MDSTEILDNWKAAGLLAGMAAGHELRKLSEVYLLSEAIERKVVSVEKVAGVVVEEGKSVIKAIKPLGMAALQSAIGATVGTIVGKNIGKSGPDSARADKNIAVAAPSIFSAGFDEGMRRGLTQAALQGSPKREAK